MIGVFLFGIFTVISNIRDRVYSRNLIAAIEASDYIELEELLEKKGNVDAVPYSGFHSFFLEIFNDPPIFYAIRNGDTESVKLLLEHGANPNLSSDGYTPLNEALQSKNIERFDIANLLLDYGADVDLDDRWGVKPVLYFTQGYNRNDDYTKGYALFLRFLSLGTIPENSQEFTYGNYLLYAVTTNNVLIVDYLLNTMNYDIHSTGKNGASTLIRATQYNAILVVQYLIENGVDIFYSDSFNKTAYDYAVEKNFTEIMGLLD